MAVMRRALKSAPMPVRLKARGITLSLCAALIVAMTPLALVAQTTYSVTGIRTFETGFHRLATLNVNHSAPPTIDWGDGTAAQPGILDCPFIGDCDVFGTHIYQLTGTYTITISYVRPVLPGVQTATTTAKISPPGDFVILSLGDSVASGEGNPANGVFAAWDDPGSIYHYSYDDQNDPDGSKRAETRVCHRSGFAGPALAATTVGRTNSITFIHYACSGDDVGDTIQQLQRVRKDNRLPRIDLLLLSTGANNVAGGFGNLVSKCIINVDAFGVPCQDDPDFVDEVDQSIVGLGPAYDELDAYIRCRHPLANCTSDLQIPKLVLITEYFDPTHNEDGEFPQGLENVGCVGSAITAEQWAWLYDNVVVPLNEQVHRSPWISVNGIQDDFLKHGYCADDQSWVVQIGESLVSQGDQNGTSHPNARGHESYEFRLVPTIDRFYPPVTTATAVTADGLPYAFGTWTAQDVEVTLSAHNPIKEAGVGNTYYAIDDPTCDSGGPLGGEQVGNCNVYSGPFSLTTGGQQQVTFFSENGYDESSSPYKGREALQTVGVWIDKDPPVMTCSATPSELWPPNGRYLPVTISVEAVDEVSGPAPFWLASITSSEGDASSDVVGFTLQTPDLEGQILARRSGSGSGRVYSLVYESVDDVGNVGSCLVEVVVPHDQRS